MIGVDRKSPADSYNEANDPERAASVSVCKISCGCVVNDAADSVFFFGTPPEVRIVVQHHIQQGIMDFQ
jgi:hypothetical protein